MHETASNIESMLPRKTGGRGKRPLWRRVLRWIFYILCAHVALFLLLTLLLYFPPVQDWLVGKATKAISEEMGKDLSVDRLRVTFLLDIDMQRLLIRETEGDTLVFAESCVLDLDCSSLLRGRVGVEALDLRKAKVNTKDWIGGLLLEGRLERLYLDVHDVDLNTNHVNLTKARIYGCEVDVALRDTTNLDEDTTKTDLPWFIQFSDVCLTDSRIAFHTVGDTMSVKAGLRKAMLEKGRLDLARQQLCIVNLSLQVDSLAYDQNFVPSREGFDPNHLLLFGINTCVKRLEYDFEKNKLHFRLAEMQMRERCGFLLEQLWADILIDTTGVNVNDMELRTPDSHIVAGANVEWTALTLQPHGRMSARLSAQIGEKDFFLLTGQRIPTLQLSVGANAVGTDYRVNMQLLQGRGEMALKAHYDAQREAYEAKLMANRLTVSNFLPLDSVLSVTAQAEISGRGLDVLSPRSNARFLTSVAQINYGNFQLCNLHLDGLLADGQGSVNFRSDNSLFAADGCIETLLKRRKLEQASFDIDLRGIDFHALGITQKPLTASMSLHANGFTDLKTKHHLQASVNAMQLQTADSTYYPKDIDLALFMQPDSLFADLQAGDLTLHLNSPQGLPQVLACLQNYGDEMVRQVREKDYDQQHLKTLLPNVDLCIKSGRSNPLANISAMMGYAFQEMDIDLHCDTLAGLNGHGWMHRLQTQAIRLDTLQFSVAQGDEGMELRGRVCNNRLNPDIAFDSRLNAILTPHNAHFNLQYFDEKGRKGIDLGTEVRFHNRCIRAHINPLHPTLAYRQFALNDSNFVFVDSLGRIDADLNLLADDGTGFKLFSTPNEQAEQDLTLSLNRVNLGQIFTVLPYMPLVSGFLQGDIHLLKTEDFLSVGTDLQVNGLTYEGCTIGNVGVNAAYMPNSDGTHFVDGFLTHDNQEVATFNGLYQGGEKTDSINAELELLRFPLTLANGFLGDMLQLSGNLNGGIQVQGALASPKVNGGLRTESLHMLLPAYSIDLRVPDETISVSDGRLDLSNLKAYSTGTQPLQLGGYIDFSSPSAIKLDVSLNARDFELINAPRNRKAEAYGKMFVDMSAQIRGLATDLDVTGHLDVLGKSDLTYVVKDSPITVEDEMADLVTFVDFCDTLKVEKVEVEIPSNFTMRLGVSINQAAQVRCLLSEDGVNYANIEGGGDLTLTYDARRGLQLFGRYTIQSGRMNYTLMVVSLKDCQIARGSYVEWSGDVTNPRLNIAASERLNTTVTENQTPRSVAFDVGLNVTQTLGDMGLEFTLEAPEDMNIQNEIAQMTNEQRGRVAVTLMATGMYVVEGKSSGGFNTTNALNSFLNSQISKITGKALNSIDLSLGVQNTNTARGNVTTDYSFRFSKRFWGNRISLIVGGKVSSGAEAENTGENIIDNVSIEYRLDKNSTCHVTLYYDKNYESILEGQVTEMGAGLLLRRKSTRLRDLFLFRNQKDKKGGLVL